MIPIHDDNPTHRVPVVTIALIAVCVAIHVFLQPGGDGRALVELPALTTEIDELATTSAELGELRFLLSWAAIPCELRHNRPLSVGEVVATFAEEAGDRDACGSGSGAGELRLSAFPEKNPALSALASMFLHGGWLHLIGNVLSLWIFGNNVEDYWGRLRYLAFYLFGGIAALVAVVAIGPDSTVPVVGASGAIAAVMGAYAVLFPKARVLTIVPIGIPLPLRVPALVVLAVWFVSQFLIDDESIAWPAHVGGFVFGLIVAGIVVMVRGRPAPPDRARSGQARGPSGSRSGW